MYLLNVIINNLIKLLVFQIRNAGQCEAFPHKQDLRNLDWALLDDEFGV